MEIRKDREIVATDGYKLDVCENIEYPASEIPKTLCVDVLC